MSSTSMMLWGLLFGSIGTGYFIYGKKQRRAVPLACGVILVVYPYFISSVLLMVAIGAILSIAPYFIRS